MRLFIHHHFLTLCVLGIGGVVTTIIALVRGF